MSSVSRCTAVLRGRAYVTLVLGGREGLRGALVTEVALHRFARRVVSLIRACDGRISFFRTNTPRRSIPFLASLPISFGRVLLAVR